MVHDRTKSWFTPVKIGLVMVGILVVGAAAHVGTAFHTVKSLNQAGLSGDANTLAADVDYPALTRSFEASMGAKMAVTVAASPGFMRPMVESMNTILLRTLSNNLMTPEGVAQILNNGNVPTARQVDASGKPLSKSDAASTDQGPHYSTHFRNASTLAVTYNGEQGSGLTLLIKSEGPFVWKLAGIEIPVPASLTKAAATNAKTAAEAAAKVQHVAPASSLASSGPVVQVPAATPNVASLPAAPAKP